MPQFPPKGDGEFLEFEVVASIGLKVAGWVAVEQVPDLDE